MCVNFVSKILKLSWKFEIGCKGCHERWLIWGWTFSQPLQYLRTLISKEEFVDETLLTNSIVTKAVEFPEEIREIV